MAWTWPWGRRPGGAQTLAPEITKQAAASTGFIALHLSGAAEWSRRDYCGLASAGYLNNPVVHSAVRLVAQTAAAVPWLLYEGVDEHDTHPVLDLLARPNGRQSGAAFMEALYGQLLLSGNAYVERVDAGSDARELHLLRPDRVSVETDADGWPEALGYSAGKGKRYVPLGADGQALHVALFSPLDDHYGLSPLSAASMALDTHNAAATWNKALLDNSARPSGALVYAPRDGGNLTDEQYDRLKEELESGYGGPARAGRPLLLEGGLDWKTMALSPRDMDFNASRNAAARDIALAIGVPPMLLWGDLSFWTEGER